jgi:misacylated tRNA(Ala) deacylase
VNREAQKGYTVSNREISREEFAKGDLLRTATDLVDPNLARIRLTDIEGLDVQADGGTHVRNTSEVGRIAMGKAENKGKGHRRLSYQCL